jgi:hypothetical protein
LPDGLANNLLPDSSLKGPIRKRMARLGQNTVDETFARNGRSRSRGRQIAFEASKDKVVISNLDT